MNTTRFWILAFQMFIILKLYDLWVYVGGGYHTFFIFLVIIVLLTINIFFKYELGRNIPSLLPFKLIPKYTKTGQAIDIVWITTGAIIFSFALGYNYNNLVLSVLILLMFIFSKILSNTKDKLLNQFRFTVLGSAVGLFCATSYSNNWLLILTALIGNFVVYLSSNPGEF